MELEIGLSRFKNIDGVSCYMISILHILQQMPTLRKFIINKKYIPLIEDKINNENEINNFVIYEFARLITLSLQNDNIKIAPVSFKKLMGKKNSMWTEIEHQDSQEFYTYLITKIEEECGQKVEYIPEMIENKSSNKCVSWNEVEIKPFNYWSAKPKLITNINVLQLLALKYIHKSETTDYSLIKNMFIGYLISNTQCYYCSTNSPCFEAFITLSLSIPINKNTNMNLKYRLEECLDNMVKDEKLDEDNKLTCDICGLKNQSIKKVQIWKSPQILVIQLKRFITNSFGVQTAKISNPVIYPVYNFDISEYFHLESPYKENSTYNLIGINIHREIGFGSINAGHYVSIIKNKYNNKWYIFDDAKNPKELEENEIQNKNAYLLFYYKN